MCPCFTVCTHTRINTRKNTHTHTHTSHHTHIHTEAHTCVQTHTRTTCTHTRTRTHTHTPANTQIPSVSLRHAHPHPHTYTHKQTYTHIYTLQGSCALSLAQRLATWFLIAQGWHAQVTSRKPFTYCLIRTATNTDAHPAERNLALQLLQYEQAQHAEQQGEQGQLNADPHVEGSSAGRSLAQLCRQTPLEYVLSRSTPLLDAGPPDAKELEELHLAGWVCVCMCVRV